MRLPDRLFLYLDRICREQRAIRRREVAEASAAYDRAIHEQAARDLAKHRAGECGPDCHFRHDERLPE